MGYSKSEILRNKDNMREEAGRPREFIKSLVIITGTLESSNPRILLQLNRRRILFS
jgi:hypothetical protein